jgi:acetyltransferase-like isoleucine patch superfamily enzyme
MAQPAVTGFLGRVLNVWRRGVGKVWIAEARFRGAELGRHVVFQGRPILTLAPGSRMRLSDDVVIASATRATALACHRPSTLRTLNAGAELIVDRNVEMSAVAICAAKSIRIGEGTIFGAGAMVFDTDFHHPGGEWEWDSDAANGARPVVVGRGVFVGAFAIILKGVTVGDRAIIGAGAVVTRDVPPHHLAVGNPAQIKPANKER